jgi:outer membrane receptor protein involved in Fe transport
MKLKRMLLAPAGLLVTALAVFSSAALAGTSGKIAGTIFNTETKELIAGATITIDGIDVTCVSDADGEFYLINVPVGTYTLTARSIGHLPLAKSDVKVLLDLTTPVDFELEATTIATNQVITVRAEKPLLAKDRTASVNVITRDELRNFPNALSIDKIINATAGVVADANGDLHVRGGRDGSNSYYFDDVPVQDPFYGSMGTRISPEALEELDVVPGGFSAEYGEALSGVISAMTQEGGPEYHGKLKFGDGMTRPYEVTSGEFGDFRRIGEDLAVGNLGGPIPYFYKDYKATFFSSSEYRDFEGYLPHNHTNSFSQTGKLAFQPTPSMKAQAFGNFYRARRLRYVHRDVNDISYDYNLDGAGIIKSESSRLGLKWTYTPRENMVFNVRLNHFETWTKLAPQDLFDTYWNQWPGYSEDANGQYTGDIHVHNYNHGDSYFGAGFTEGDDFYPVYSYRFSSYKSLSSDMLVQLDKHNQVKIGAEYRVHRLSWDNKQFFNAIPYGEKYLVRPRYASAYLQDKIEMRHLIVNAGLRFDYLDAAVAYWDNPVTKNSQLTSEPKSKVSPRLGMSHPISDHTVIHFNYGLYYQVPLYAYMYTNLDAELNSGFPLVGNPNLEPEQTIAYEVGLSHMISENAALKFVTYYRDISNLTSTQLVRYPGGSYVAYTNSDYGSVKGFDVIFNIQKTRNLSGSLNYGYMIARGNSSDPNEGYYDYFTQADPPVYPVKEYRLSFDQRHTISLNADFRIPRDYNAKVFGVSVPDAWGINVLAQYGSGMPYTKTDNEGNRIGLLNEGQMPATYTVDLKVNKDFYFSKSGKTFLSLFVEVENLFDRRNVIAVYSNTGKADDDGRDPSLTQDPDGDGPITTAQVNEVWDLLAKDPQNYDSPRRIQWGMELIF